jgi:hypothetical protein
MKFSARPVRAVQIFAVLAMVLMMNGSSADAAGPTPVGLGTAADFAVLAGQSVTNTGPTMVVDGNLGVSPGSAVNGFPPGQMVNGTIHAADGVASQAQVDLTTAYNDAAERTGGTPVSGDVGGLTFTPGVYNAPSSLGITETLTLDGQGDSNAVFIFQIGSTLTTASGSHVALINQASPCNVFWQIGSSATLGTDSVFTGTILALTSITVTTGTTVAGRTLARNGSVTLDTNTITAPSCPAASTSTTTTTGPGGGTTTTTLPGGGATTTTINRTAATTTTIPGGGTTTTTGPGGGVTTTTTAAGVRPPLASSGTGVAAALALWGLAMTMTGGLCMLATRRGR